MSSVARFRAMGCEVVVAGATAAELDRVRALFEERDRIFSRFRPESELNRVNAAAGRFVRISTPFARALGAALEVAAATRGVLDPTLPGTTTTSSGSAPRTEGRQGSARRDAGAASARPASACSCRRECGLT